MNFIYKKKKAKKRTKEEVILAPLHEQKDFARHQSALEQSVVLIGPTDVGKSVFGRHFAKKYGLVYIDMQEILHCKKNIKSIEADIDLYKHYIHQTKNECRNSIARRYAGYARIERQNLEFRKNFPNVPNLADLNYKNGEVLYMLKQIDGFDDICAATYMKKYENTILKEIIEQINTPCVLDTTTELPVNLNKEYAKRLPFVLAEFNKNAGTKYCALNKYLQDNNLSIYKLLEAPTESFEDIYNTIHQIKNVVRLEYPLGCNTKNTPLHNCLVKSGHYEKMAANKTIVADFIGTDQDGFSVLKKQQLTECMDIVAAYICDYNPQIYSCAKEIEIAF